MEDNKKLQFDVRAQNSPAVKRKIETSQVLSIMNEELERIHADRRASTDPTDRAHWDAILKKLIDQIFSLVKSSDNRS